MKDLQTSSFFVTLPSDSSSDLYPDNKTNKWSVQLNKEIQLDTTKDWYVNIHNMFVPEFLHFEKNNWGTITLTPTLTDGFTPAGPIRKETGDISGKGWQEILASLDANLKKVSSERDLVSLPRRQMVIMRYLLRWCLLTVSLTPQTPRIARHQIIGHT